MHGMLTARIYAWMLVMTAVVTPPAMGVQIQDLVRIKGSESSRLTGMGLVVGLKGTGDGGKYLPAMRNLVEAINHFADPNALAVEMKDVKNVALVSLEAIVPAAGVQEGDLLDVHVSAIGSAKSLEGGRLFMTALTGPLRGSPVYAFASGSLTLESADIPTVAVVKNGAQMTRSIHAQFMNEQWQVTLVLQHSVAGWPVANNLASLISGLEDGTGPPIARAIDPKNVVVTIPPAERKDPAGFLSYILQSYIDATQINTGARVKINERTGTITFSGNVEISPVVITHNGLTITSINPPPTPSAVNPAISRDPFVGLDPQKRGGAKLADLLSALNQLKVDARDRIAIVKEIEKLGALHAKLEYE